MYYAVWQDQYWNEFNCWQSTVEHISKQLPSFLSITNSLSPTSAVFSFYINILHHLSYPQQVKVPSLVPFSKHHWLSVAFFIYSSQSNSQTIVPYASCHVSPPTRGNNEQVQESRSDIITHSHTCLLSTARRSWHRNEFSTIPTTNWLPTPHIHRLKTSAPAPPSTFYKQNQHWLTTTKQEHTQSSLDSALPIPSSLTITKK